MSSDKEHFNSAAKNWDNDPMKIARAEAVAASIRKYVPLTKKMNALEFGAGTGQLSFLLKKDLGPITLMDEAAEMLKIANEKIALSAIADMQTKEINLLTHDYSERHDLIYTQMVLHHVKDTKTILSKFHTILNVNGYLCIADLVEEDGSFHTHIPGFDGHNGYNLDELTCTLENLGFKVLSSEICYNIVKDIKGIKKEYPLFVLIAQKS